MSEIVRPAEPTLSERERMFVEEYTKDLNGKAAAIRAGYSPKSAAPIASTLLNKVAVSQAIDSALSARSIRTRPDRRRRPHDERR